MRSQISRRLDRTDSQISEVTYVTTVIAKPIMVFRNGILQSENVDYTFSFPNTINWIFPPENGDHLSVLYY